MPPFLIQRKRIPASTLAMRKRYVFILRGRLMTSAISKTFVFVDQGILFPSYLCGRSAKTYTKVCVFKRKRISVDGALDLMRIWMKSTGSLKNDWKYTYTPRPNFYGYKTWFLVVSIICLTKGSSIWNHESSFLQLQSHTIMAESFILTHTSWKPPNSMAYKTCYKQTYSSL